MKKIKLTKKAAYVWISWILLMAFVVTLSAIMYNWIFGYAHTSSESIEKRYDESECEFIGISINNICQETEKIQIDVTNRNSIKVEKIIFRFYNIYGDPINPSQEVRVDIKPDKTERIMLPKSGVVKTIEAIPATIKENYEVVCREKMASIPNADDIQKTCS